MARVWIGIAAAALVWGLVGACAGPPAAAPTDERIARVQEVFGDAARVDPWEGPLDMNLPSAPRDLRLYRVLSDEGPVGVCAEARVTGRSGPFPIRVLLDGDGTVRSVEVLAYAYQRGRGVLQQNFLRQFQGKHAGDPMTLAVDLDGVTGATLSCRAVSQGVRQISEWVRDVSPARP